MLIMNRRRAKVHGLTLLEVLIALVLIAVAFGVLASTQISNIQVTRDAKQVSIALQAGNRAMEVASKRVLDAGFRCPTGASPCTGNVDIDVEGTSYSATYVATVPAGTPENGLGGVAQVDVSVTEPVEVQMSQFVSCMDVTPPPSFEEPAPCPDPRSAP